MQTDKLKEWHSEGEKYLLHRIYSLGWETETSETRQRKEYTWLIRNTFIIIGVCKEPEWMVEHFSVKAFSTVLWMGDWDKYPYTHSILYFLMLLVVGVGWQAHHSGTANQNPTSPFLKEPQTCPSQQCVQPAPGKVNYWYKPIKTILFLQPHWQLGGIMWSSFGQWDVGGSLSGASRKTLAFFLALNMDVMTRVANFNLKRKGRENHRNPNYIRPQLLKSRLFIMREK